MTEPMNDREFIGYCRAHSGTPRALFSRHDCERIHALAGVPMPDRISDFVRIDKYAMRPLCDRAELRLTAERDAALQRAREAVDEAFDADSVECSNCGARLLLRCGSIQHGGISQTGNGDLPLCGFCMGKEFYALDEKFGAVCEERDALKARIAELEQARDEAKAECATALDFLRAELGWEAFRVEFQIGKEKVSLSAQNADKLRAFLAEKGHAIRFLESRESDRQTIAALRKALEPFAEMFRSRWMEGDEICIRLLPDMLGLCREAATALAASAPQEPQKDARQRRLREWFDRNGGKVTALRAALRAQEELNELIESLNSQDRDSDCLEEAADTFLCLLLVADLLGGNLMDAADRKMDKNESRTWRVDSSGALYHVRASAPQEPKQ